MKIYRYICIKVFVYVACIKLANIFCNYLHSQLFFFVTESDHETYERKMSSIINSAPFSNPLETKTYAIFGDDLKVKCKSFQDISSQSTSQAISFQFLHKIKQDALL